MKVHTRRREVDAERLTNGNWLVTEADGSRQSMSPESFAAMYECDWPETKCGVCGALAFGKCGHNNPVTS